MTSAIITRRSLRRAKRVALQGGGEWYRWSDTTPNSRYFYDGHHVWAAFLASDHSITFTPSSRRVDIIRQMTLTPCPPEALQQVRRGL